MEIQGAEVDQRSAFKDIETMLCSRYRVMAIKNAELKFEMRNDLQINGEHLA